MLQRRASPYIDPSCPAGGSFFACPSGSRFLGCCQSDDVQGVCQNGCSAGNLKPSSFNASYYGQFSDQECSTGQYYVCASTTPPFLGCCTSVACHNDDGCPASDLAPAFLSQNPAEAADFLSSSVSSSDTSTSTSTSAAQVTVSSNHAPAVSPAAIAGIVLGSVAFIAIAAFTAYIFLSRRRRKLHHESVVSSPTLADRCSFQPTPISKTCRNYF